MKRSLCMAALLLCWLCASGCGLGARHGATPLPTPATPEMPETSGAPVPADALAVREALSLAGGSYRSADPGLPAIDVAGGGRLQASGLTIDKTGDGLSPATGAASGMLPGGENAAVRVAEGGQASFSGSAITSGAAGGHALFVSGPESSAALSDTMVVATGCTAAAVYANGGASISAASCDLFADGEGAASLFLTGDGEIRCAQAQISAGGTSVAAALYGGTLTLTDCTVLGDLRFHGAGNRLDCTRSRLEGTIRFPDAEDEADISLSDSSLFCGATGGDGAIGISISLDATSRWQLTGDSYVAGFVNADESFSNIESAGFSIYYNSELEANAALAGRSYALPGGGFLIPLI